MVVLVNADESMYTSKVLLASKQWRDSMTSSPPSDSSPSTSSRKAERRTDAAPVVSHSWWSVVLCTSVKVPLSTNGCSVARRLMHTVSADGSAARDLK